MRPAQFSPGGRYPVLRAIAILWLVGAAVALVVGVVQAIATLVGVHQIIPTGGAHWGGRVSGFFIWLAMTFFAVIFNIAIAELIKLAIDLEHNTRMTAMNTASTAFPAATGASVPTGTDGSRSRLADESAESALLRGH